MIRTVFVFVVLLHGLIHLVGFAKAFEYAELPQLAQPISRSIGLLWFVAAVLLVAVAATIALWPRWWWLLGALALVASQSAIGSSWNDAKLGTLPNVVLLMGVLYGFASRGPLSLRAEYETHVHAARPAASWALLTETDLAPLTEPPEGRVTADGR